MTNTVYTGGTIAIGTVDTEGAHVGGDLLGQVAVGTLTGEIRVLGVLGDPNHPTTPEIHVTPAMGSAAAIAIDWDGFDPTYGAERWDPNASVIVPDPNDPNGELVLHYSWPAGRVYEITTCKSDCNGDQAVDFADVDPFIAAMDAEGYAEAFPGLTGSRRVHADISCDGAVNSDDMAPFI